MAYDHFRPPEHFSPKGRFFFRALCWVTFIIVMGLVVAFIVPWAYENYTRPFAEWSADIIFGPDVPK